MNKYLPLLLLATAWSGGTQAFEFGKVQADKSTLSFAYKQMGVPSDGKFRKFSAAIAFDPAKPDSASVRIEIDMAGLDAGYKEANDEVTGKLWFNTKAFPTARFVSTGVKSLGGNHYEVVGKLTIKDKTLPVNAPFTFKQEGAVGVFDGSLTINRLDYAIGVGAWADVGTVADEVRVVFHVVAAATSAKK